MRIPINNLIDDLPHPESELLPGVKWGRCDELFTPAYWKIQYHLCENQFSSNYYTLGQSIIEEVCACILGGFGIKAELGFLAFERLLNLELLVQGTKFELLYVALSIPLFDNGKWIKYRFPKQKAKYLFEFLNRADLNEIPANDDMQLRKWLLSVNGIGMKTASWITRNWLQSNKVAIIDIHIYRAGLISGLFDFNVSIEKDYEILEQRYLAFSSALNVSAANLDALMWLQLKSANEIVINIINEIGKTNNKSKLHY